jgi:hypothetical protein
MGTAIAHESPQGELFGRAHRGNVPRKNMAAAEEFDANQLRLFSGHAHTAEVGISETHESEDH